MRKCAKIHPERERERKGERERKITKIAQQAANILVAMCCCRCTSCCICYYIYEA